MVNAFYPTVATVQQGDVLNFQFQDVHTVTFGPDDEIQDRFIPPIPNLFAYFGPSIGTEFDGHTYVNSGVMIPGTSFNVTVTAPAGTYMYRCMLHPLMKGYIVVAGTRESQSAMTTRGNNEKNSDFVLAPTLVATALTDLAVPTIAEIFPLGPPTTATVQVSLGFGNGHVDFLTFFPQNITVSAGTVVKYINRDPFEPHTVTFQEPPLNDPQGFVPAGTPVITSANVYSNSGWLWPALFGGLDTYDLTFQDAGVYKIFCALHDDEGMIQWVTVTA